MPVKSGSIHIPWPPPIRTSRLALLLTSTIPNPGRSTQETAPTARTTSAHPTGARRADPGRCHSNGFGSFGAQRPRQSCNRLGQRTSAPGSALLNSRGLPSKGSGQGGDSRRKAAKSLLRVATMSDAFITVGRVSTFVRNASAWAIRSALPIAVAKSVPKDSTPPEDEVGEGVHNVR